MKTTLTKSLLGVLLTVLSLSTITSCSDEVEILPITLQDVEDNSRLYLYPSSNAYAITIKGGDGTYAAICDKPAVFEVKLCNEKKTISVKPLSIGDATVIITDQSNNSYTLNLKSRYQKEHLIVTKQEILIVGDKLSTEQKKEIEQKAMQTFPVKLEGGYEMTYNNEKGFTKGDLLIYVDKDQENEIEGTFERNIVDLELFSKRPVYTFTVEGKNREFILTEYINTGTRLNSLPVTQISFLEDLTDQFKADYPGVEKVYSQQLLQGKLPSYI